MGEAAGGYVVSLTRLRLRGWWLLPAFFGHARPTVAQARGASGCVYVATRKKGWLTFWTLSVWESEGAMLEYVRSGAHLRAMPILRRICDEAATVRWVDTKAAEMDGKGLWAEGERRVSTEGRLHPVDRPSRRQAGGRLPGSTRR